MHRLVRESIRGVGVFQLAVELGWVTAAIVLAGILGNPHWTPSWKTLTSAISFVLLLLCFNTAFGFYRRGRRIPWHEHIPRAVLLLCVEFPLAYIGAKVLLGGGFFPQGIGFAVLYAICALTVLRHLGEWLLARALLPRRVLVLGTGPEARSVETSIAATDPRGLDLIGFCALGHEKEIAVAANRIVATSASIREAVKRRNIDEIVVAVAEQRGGVLPMDALLDCRLQGIRVTDLSRFFERVHGRVPIAPLKASWLIFGQGFRQHRWRQAIKRCFDVVVVAGLLISALPIIAVATLGILVSSGMPVIYRQERVGYRGRTFTLLKFRSMARDAERDGVACWATVGDSRITRFGRFIRETRIDELPQLINVLKGEMSLVGPRPERPSFVAELTRKIPFYAVRHCVRPGITGWAQVRYSYGATVEESVKKLEYDIYYVKNNSLLLDLAIMFKTVRVVLLGEGAR